MTVRWTKVVQGVDRLSLRERLFLFAAGLFVLGGLWQAVLAGPLAERERLANEAVTALQGRLEALDASLSAAAVGVSEGVPEQLERVRALRESVQARDEEMRAFTTDLVDPAQMRARARGAAAPPRRAHSRQRRQSSGAARARGRSRFAR